jgi:hypothetical protein
LQLREVLISGDERPIWASHQHRCPALLKKHETPERD